MELLKISEGALKVCLTREDMEFFDIEFDEFDYSNAQTRRVIWTILDEAKRTLGFEAVRENLYIRAFRCMSGGCELFVSREESQKGKEPILYRFDSGDMLIRACARLRNCAFNGESRLFAGDDGRFYLVLCTEGGVVYLDELGARLDYCAAYLSEHANEICENAVQEMAKLR